MRTRRAAAAIRTWAALLCSAAAARAEENESTPTSADPGIAIARVSVTMKSLDRSETKQDLDDALEHTKAADESRERMAAVLAGEASLFKAGKLRGQARIDSLEASARAGDAAAASALGDMLDTGDGVAEDPVRALGYYRAAALGRRMDAAHNLGVAYSKGRGVRRDLTEALAWLIVARSRGDESGVDEQLREHLRRRGLDGAIATAEKRAAEWLTTPTARETVIAALPPVAPIEFEAARAGAVETVDEAQLRRHAGDGTNSLRQDAAATTPPVVVMTILGERLSWPSLGELQRAVNRGDRAALTAMGRLMTSGKRVPADPLGAIVLLERAAAMGEVDAAHQLGDLYSKSEGVVPDDAKAFTYFTQAAKGGSTLAMASLGVFYTNGRGTKADLAQGLAWLIVAKGYGVDLGQEKRLRGFLEKNRPADVAKAEELAGKLRAEVAARVTGAR